MRWIWYAGLTTFLLACTHAPLRCEGSLQPINADTNLAPDSSQPAAPRRATP